MSFVPSENHEAKCLSRWLDAQIAAGANIKYSHLPLETLTDMITAVNLIRMGVRRGVPDYLLCINDRVHFIELKRTAGGRVSEEQKAWIAALQRCGVGAHVCKGFREARALVTNLLDVPK